MEIRLVVIRGEACVKWEQREEGVAYRGEMGPGSDETALYPDSINTIVLVTVHCWGIS